MHRCGLFREISFVLDISRFFINYGMKFYIRTKTPVLFFGIVSIYVSLYQVDCGLIKLK